MNNNNKVVLKLEYIEKDDWSRPVYKDQYGKLWIDIALGNNETPSLYSSTGNEFNGEPDYPIKKEFDITKHYVKNNNEFQYMMLSRLISDCETHLNTWNRYRRRLKKDDATRVINKMKELWNGFTDEEKPKWLTWEQILDYEKRML